jgi:hypothetical protein
LYENSIGEAGAIALAQALPGSKLTKLGLARERERERERETERATPAVAVVVVV